MRLVPLSVALLVACQVAERDEPTPIDLVSRLGEDQVRAGVITDPRALFGGVSAEGQPGDVKIYNDRVQFVIQGARRGSFYVGEGGGVIDADVVRPEGVPGRDPVDEWVPMFGLGRILEPARVEVVSDGSDGAAVVRVDGTEAAFALLEGALESPGFLTPLGLEPVTEYRLEPGSWLLEVTTTLTATQDVSVAAGDILIGAPEAAWTWSERNGLGDDDAQPRLWSGYLGHASDVAVLMASDDGAPLELGNLSLLTELTDMQIGFEPVVTLAPGESVSFTRYWGVGPDAATLTDAVQAAWGRATEALEGVVTDGAGPVAGARVAVQVDGVPFTVAITGEDGGFSAQVPAGAAASAVAVGRGTGRVVQHPAGAAPYGPYGGEPTRVLALEALAEGAPPVPHAEGYGVGAPEAPLQLTPPAVLRVEVDDGLPFAVQVRFLDGDAPVDPRNAPRRAGGYAAAGWSRGGALELPVEPGRYQVVVLRGLRFEVHQEEVTLASGRATEVEAALPAAYEHAGWLLGDPHAHASPSGDGGITMEDRLVVHAAHGLQVHFGTDHDHLADYRPLLPALGLDGVLATVVADEVSPPARGHFNIYPVEPQPEPNGGAWTWWEDIPTSTEGMVDALRGLHGEAFILQSNHPTDSGVASSASWRAGQIGRADYWTDRLEAVEVLNSADHDAFFPFWMDLLLRGAVTTPVGVSDSHHHFGGHLGTSATWLGVGVDDPRELTDAVLVETMRAHRTIATTGPFLALSVPPGGVVAAGAEVSVEALAPSWIQVDRLVLLRDGVEAARVDGTSATFTLDADADAAFVIVAEGDRPMLPVDGARPWAATAAWLVDVDGDGWLPPLAPLAIGG